MVKGSYLGNVYTWEEAILLKISKKSNFWAKIPQNVTFGQIFNIYVVQSLKKSWFHLNQLYMKFLLNYELPEHFRYQKHL